MSNTYNQAGRRTIDYEQVCYRPEPTDCTSTTLTSEQPNTTIPDFNTVTVVENPNGYGVTTPNNMINGNTAGGNFGRLNTGGGNAFNMVLDFAYTTPVNNPAAIYLWTQGGNNLNDGDGVGSYLATLYDSSGNVLWTGTGVGGNGGDIKITDLPTGLMNVSRLRMENITKSAQGGASNIHIRLIRLVGEYEIIYQYDCNDVVVNIRGETGNVTLTPTTINQTSTPHQLTFSHPNGDRFSGRIITNQPGRFSKLTFSNDSPNVEFTGTGSAPFAIETFLPDDPANEIRSGTMHFDRETGTRTLHDTLTGAEVTGQQIVPCEEEEDEPCCFQYIQLCDDDGPFFRRFNNDGTHTDFQSDLTTEYSVVGDIRTCDSRNVVIQTYRLSGQGSGTSTVSTAPNDNPTVGNTLTIPPGFQSISWEWLRQTQQDPGDGTVASLIVNGFIYYPGSGSQYQTVGKSIDAEHKNTATNSYRFDVSGQAFLEVTVIR